MLKKGETIERKRVRDWSIVLLKFVKILSFSLSLSSVQSLEGASDGEGDRAAAEGEHPRQRLQPALPLHHHPPDSGDGKTSGQPQMRRRSAERLLRHRQVRFFGKIFAAK